MAGLIDWLMGKQAEDVELPNESGRIDKRLPKDNRNVVQRVGHAFSDFSKIGETETVKRKK